MCKKKRILAYQKEQSIVKQEILKIKKKRPFYLVVFLFSVIILIFTVENKVYTYFKGTLNFLILSFAVAILLCIVYLLSTQQKIKKRERLSKAIGLKLYQLMKLEHE